VPRRSQAEARQTRAAIVERAVELSSLEGLEGLTLGRLAGELRMSKSGVVGHFGTKEGLQLATLEAANAIFKREVWDRTEDVEPGLPRLLATCDAWISYLERAVFPGGCFMTAAACELDGRDGPMRDAVAAAMARWYGALEHQVRVAIDAGDLPARTEPREVALKLNAFAMAANQRLQLFGDHDAAETARRAMRAGLCAREA
jgi:AcrR family transcriptional regulator